MKTRRDESSTSDDNSTSTRPLLSWTAWTTTIVLQCVFGVIATQYDASHTNSARYPLPSNLCIPSLGTLCPLQIAIPTVVLDPSPVLFVNAVMLYASAVLATYNLRRADSYQDYIIAIGILGGAVICGIVGPSQDIFLNFKDYMPATITTSLVLSTILHQVRAFRSE